MENISENGVLKENHRFILFVSGMSPKSSYAVENIRRICDQHLPEAYDLQIIDINRERHLAVEYQIVAIPTLMKMFPAPKRTILGDLSDTTRVLQILDLTE